jgi:hypothetical protein
MPRPPPPGLPNCGTSPRSDGLHCAYLTTAWGLQCSSLVPLHTHHIHAHFTHNFTVTHDLLLNPTQQLLENSTKIVLEALNPNILCARLGARSVNILVPTACCTEKLRTDSTSGVPRRSQNNCTIWPISGASDQMMSTSFPNAISIHLQKLMS